MAAMKLQRGHEPVPQDSTFARASERSSSGSLVGVGGRQRGAQMRTSSPQSLQCCASTARRPLVQPGARWPCAALALASLVFEWHQASYSHLRLELVGL